MDYGAEAETILMHGQNELFQVQLRTMHCLVEELKCIPGAYEMCETILRTPPGMPMPSPNPAAAAAAMKRGSSQFDASQTKRKKRGPRSDGGEPCPTPETGCTHDPVYSRGLCKNCYARWRRAVRVDQDNHQMSRSSNNSNDMAAPPAGRTHVTAPYQSMQPQQQQQQPQFDFQVRQPQPPKLGNYATSGDSAFYTDSPQKMTPSKRTRINPNIGNAWNASNNFGVVCIHEDRKRNSVGLCTSCYNKFHRRRKEFREMEDAQSGMSSMDDSSQSHLTHMSDFTTGSVASGMMSSMNSISMSSLHSAMTTNNQHDHDHGDSGGHMTVVVPPPHPPHHPATHDGVDSTPFAPPLVQMPLTTMAMANLSTLDMEPGVGGGAGAGAGAAAAALPSATTNLVAGPPLQKNKKERKAEVNGPRKMCVQCKNRPLLCRGLCSGCYQKWSKARKQAQENGQPPPPCPGDASAAVRGKASSRPISSSSSSSQRKPLPPIDTGYNNSLVPTASELAEAIMDNNKHNYHHSNSSFFTAIDSVGPSSYNPKMAASSFAPPHPPPPAASFSSQAASSSLMSLSSIASSSIPSLLYNDEDLPLYNPLVTSGGGFGSGGGNGRNLRPSPLDALMFGYGM